MKTAISKRLRRDLLSTLVQAARPDKRKPIPIDSAVFDAYPDKTLLMDALRALESQGYLEIKSMHYLDGVKFTNIYMTDAGFAYFENRSDKIQDMWLDHKFNLLEFVITSALAFFGGMVAEHASNFIEYIAQLITR